MKFLHLAFFTSVTLISVSCDIAKKIDPSAFSQGASPNSNSEPSRTSPSSTPTSTPTAGAPGAPTSPSGLTGSAGSSVEVNLSWSIGSTDQTGFLVQRAPLTAGPFVSSPGTFVTVATLAGNVMSYSDTGLAASTSYYYQILSTNASGSSAPSNVVEVTTQAPPVSVPLAPSALAVTPTAATLVSLSWTNNASNASSFLIYRSTNGGNTFSEIAITSSNQTTYEDYNLLAATPYTYKIEASNSAGPSTATANVTATTLAAGNTSTFTYVNTNIITPNCLGCHTNGNAAGGVNYATPSGILGSISANNTANSKMYTDMQSGKMPPGGGITALQLSQMAAWINSGAPTNN